MEERDDTLATESVAARVYPLQEIDIPDPLDVAQAKTEELTAYMRKLDLAQVSLTRQLDVVQNRLTDAKLHKAATRAFFAKVKRDKVESEAIFEAEQAKNQAEYEYDVSENIADMLNRHIGMVKDLRISVMSASKNVRPV